MVCRSDILAVQIDYPLINLKFVYKLPDHNVQYVYRKGA